MTPVEFHGRADFAEVAEAVGVSTDLVLAMNVDAAGVVTVLYSQPDDVERVFGVLLLRDDDGVLVALHPPRELVGLMDEMRARLEGES